MAKVNKLQVLISIDTTGSMDAAADEVRLKAKEIGTKIFKDCPNAEVGVIFHGDYCDSIRTYTLKKLGFTNDVVAFENFVKTTGKTDGGDADECYELVLNEARSMGWKADRTKLMIMIGDADPHEPGYRFNTGKLNWAVEAGELRMAGVQIISIQCLNNANTKFWEQLAVATQGRYLKLSQFREVEAFVMGAILQTQDPALLDLYERQLKADGKLTRSIAQNYASLRGTKLTASQAKAYISSLDTAEMKPVPATRFQVFTVPGANKLSKLRIDDFVNAKGIPYKKGRGFYPLVTRTEIVANHKEVVLEDLNTGDMFTGDKAREVLGLDKHGTSRLAPNPLPGFRVWIQSTSDNRYLRDPVMMYDIE